MLYMFQAVPPPIIRSSKVYIQHRVFYQTFTAICHCRERVGTQSFKSSTTVAGSSKDLTEYPMLYIQFWAPDDGRSNWLKHVEYFTEINKLCNTASCWLYLKMRLRRTDPWTSNLQIWVPHCITTTSSSLSCTTKGSKNITSRETYSLFISLWIPYPKNPRR